MTTFGIMRSIGVRELKAQLSRVLREVQGGETVLVTDRGRVIAELRRPGVEMAPGTVTERALKRMAADGVLRLGEPVPEAYDRSPLSLPGGTAKSLLDDERGER